MIDLLRNNYCSTRKKTKTVSFVYDFNASSNDIEFVIVCLLDNHASEHHISSKKFQFKTHTQTKRIRMINLCKMLIYLPNLQLNCFRTKQQQHNDYHWELRDKLWALVASFAFGIVCSTKNQGSIASKKHPFLFLVMTAKLMELQKASLNLGLLLNAQ